MGAQCDAFKTAGANDTRHPADTARLLLRVHFRNRQVDGVVVRESLRSEAEA